MTPHPTTSDLLSFIQASPTPRHCVAEAARRLQEAGFTALVEADSWANGLRPGAAHWVEKAGSILAFRVGQRPAAESGFRILGAHTDSPNLRVKPRADLSRHGCLQLGVDTYGGTLDYTWLDRDLGLAGVVVVRPPGAALEERLVRIDRPLLRVPSLAIHLNREVRDKGLLINPQSHLPPVLGLSLEGSGDGPALRSLLARELGVDDAHVLTWDLSLFDVVPPAVGGLHGEFIFAARLDNQAMCHAALSALVRAAPVDRTQMIVLYDHEEVGSESAEGAGGDFVGRVLRRLVEPAAGGGSPESLARACAASMQVSADMAHAVHPNYADRHEPEHQPRLNRGPVIKINRNLRYATNARTEAHFEALCQDLKLPYQKFVNRTDLACGTTIGPITSASLGIDTVDVGNPMWSMHSIRETAGARDPEWMTQVLTHFLDN